MEMLNESTSTVAQQIAHAALAFHQRGTGHAPKSVTVVLGADTLVVTLHGALSPAEQLLAQCAAAQPKCRSFTGSCSPIPANRCGRKLSGLQGSMSATQPRKLNRQAAP